MKEMLNLKNPKIYAEMFLSRMPKNERILMYGISDKRTIEIILDSFPEAEFVIADCEANLRLLRHFYEGKKYIFINTTDDKKDLTLFNEEGEIVNQKTVSSSKSADFLIEGIYFTQKYTGENTGGAQDNQFNDVVDFLTKGSIYYKVGAIVDGAYWEDMGNKEKLIENFQKNPNVIILSADDIKEGKIKNEY